MGFTQYSNTWQRSAGSLIPPRLVLLLQAIHSHTPCYRLSNAQLAQEMGCSEKYVEKLLAKAKEFRLLDIAGQPRPFRGYTRSIMLTSECRDWITKGKLPASLKAKGGDQ
jgi:AraC-like DNA-binding protein